MCVHQLLTAEVRLSELLAPDRPFRYAFEGRQRGDDFVKLSTSKRTQIHGVITRRVVYSSRISSTRRNNSIAVCDA